MAEVARLLAAAKSPHSSLCALFAICRGAAVLTKSGKFFRRNVENSSYGLTVCAERVVAFAAVIGGSRELVGIALVADMPLLRCRVESPAGFNEFVLKCGLSVPIYREQRRFRLDELLPEAFGPDFRETRKEK